VAPSPRRVVYELPVDPRWKVSARALQLGALLGEGAFGVVRAALAWDLAPLDARGLSAWPAAGDPGR
jgi:hypothetical protein